MIFKSLQATKNYIKSDWSAHPIRLVLETMNWIGNVACGFIIALTVPHAPFIWLYPIWFCCMSISIFSAWSRGSFGLLLASSSMLIIDIFGYYRLLSQ